MVLIGKRGIETSKYSQKERVDVTVIQVSKEEMKKLRERFPYIRATRTVHKYYIEENPKVMAFIRGDRKGGGRKHD